MAVGAVVEAQGNAITEPFMCLCAYSAVKLNLRTVEGLHADIIIRSFQLLHMQLTALPPLSRLLSSIAYTSLTVSRSVLGFFSDKRSE